MSAYSFDVTAADFEEKVVNASHQQPVLVDFWAEWCAPCRNLKPILEKLAEEMGGKFLLARVDTEAEPELAMHFRVRGIPDVRAIVNGEIVDGFTGALNEGQVRAFLDKLMPSPVAAQMRAAVECLHNGDGAGALAQLKQAVEIAPDDENAWLMLLEVMIVEGLFDEAEQLLPTVEMKVKDVRKFDALRARLDITRSIDPDMDPASLLARLEQNPDDLDARLGLADALLASGRWQEALEQLLWLVRKDRHYRDEAARKKMVQVFALPEVDPALVRQYRSALASSLN